MPADTDKLQTSFGYCPDERPRKRAGYRDGLPLIVRGTAVGEEVKDGQRLAPPRSDCGLDRTPRFSLGERPPGS